MITEEAKKRITEAAIRGNQTRTKEREIKILNYNDNPVLCKNCSLPILCKDNENISEVKKRRFCSHSCSAIFNNPQAKTKSKQDSFCVQCEKKLHKNQRKYCSTSCQSLYQHKDALPDWLSGKTVITKEFLPHFIRRYLIDQSHNQCSLCGWSEKNITTGKVPLEIDHIDGNARNSSLSNLRVLCPNCHSITPTYRSLNKGNGRVNR